MIEAGYSAATASQSGSRLAKDPAIVAYLAQQRSAGAQAKPASEPVPAAAAAPAAAPPGADLPLFDLAAALLHSDPKAFLLAAMNDPMLEPKLRIDSAKALMPFTHTKMGEGGKKDGRAAAAKTASTGRFGAPPPPKLVVNNGK